MKTEPIVSGWHIVGVDEEMDALVFSDGEDD
jgi:hypothetical protein